MRKIEGTISEELSTVVDPKNVEASGPYPVSTYRRLVQAVAKLAYLNKDYLLFFRGQDQDYRNKAGSSTFYPTIYRGDYLPQREVNYRFEILDEAARKLKHIFAQEEVDGYREVGRKRYIQWSILQHYQVCSTPLLDLTHSLRVACSFAQLKKENSNVYVYVFGLPYITNRISTNSEHDIVNVRLLSICPPDALRPYFQEGYLAGTEDITNEYESKTELDFKNRLIAKFEIPNDQNFWVEGFPEFPRGDRVEKICNSIINELSSEILPGQLGEFIKEWTDLETDLVSKSRESEGRVYTTREAINKLGKEGSIDQETQYSLDELRKFRNVVVHEPKRVDPGDVQEYTQKLRDLRSIL